MPDEERLLTKTVPDDPYPSIEASVQLREALEEYYRAEGDLLNTNSMKALPGIAKTYVEASERVRAARGVVQSEARVSESRVDSISRGQVIRRG